MRQILWKVKQTFPTKNKKLLSEKVLKKPIDFLFDLTDNLQMQLTTMSIPHKPETLMVEHDGKMQPNVMVVFSSKLASVLGFQKTRYWNDGEYTSESIAIMDTMNAIYVYCDVVEHRIINHTLAPLMVFFL